MKISKNSQGMFHPLMVVLVVVVIAAVGGVAWKVSSNNKDNSTSGGGSAKVANNKAVADVCNKAINDTNICNFASHYSTSTSYKATDSNTTSDDTTGTMTISTDGKGNTEINGTSDGSTFDAITLNGATYLKDASSGTWIKYASSSSSPSTTTNPADGFKISASDITGNGTITYKSLGTEACGSLTCFKYQIVDTSQSGTTQYVWFDNKNYQMHEFYTKDSNGTNDMTFNYQNVSISTPSPVQDFSAATNPYTAQ